jgi:hypothetical protein
VLQPEVLLGDDVAPRQLVRVLAECGPASPDAVIWPPDRRLTPKLRSFIEFVVAVCRLGRSDEGGEGCGWLYVALQQQEQVRQGIDLI